MIFIYSRIAIYLQVTKRHGRGPNMSSRRRETCR